MDQLSQQRINRPSQIPLKLYGRNRPLPFVDFLSTKKNHIFPNNSLQWSTPRRLLPSKAKKPHIGPLHKEDGSRVLLSGIKGSAVSSGSEIQQEREKQHSPRKQNSSKPTECSNSGQSSSGGGSSPSGTMKKLTKLLKTCIYLNYDIIATSPSCNQQIHNMTVDHSLPLSLHPPSTLPSKIPYPSPSIVSPKGCPSLQKQPKQKRIPTDPLYLDSTLGSNW